MTDKKTSKPEELTEAELDTVAGGFLCNNENITEFSKKESGKLVDGKTKGVTSNAGGSGI